MGTQAQVSPAQINAIARASIKARAVKMTQQIQSTSFTAASGNISGVQPVVTINPRNVGLILGFWVKVAFNVHNGSAVQIDLSDFGPSNVFSQIQFNDLNNNTRIQTTGWHLGFINSIKARRPFGTALVKTTGIDDPIGYGANFAAQIAAPATIAAGADGACVMWYWVPLSYSDSDLRGSVYANVVNATMQLLLTFNATPVVANGADSTSALYVGDAAGSITLAVINTATVTVYQSYYDQIPTGNIGNGQQGVLLPILDLATIYELKNTTVNGMVANQDFPTQYANFRDFLSTTAVYVNNGTSGARGTGTDINTWALQSANFTNIWKMEPGLSALMNRNHLQTDLPKGVYYFGSREKPISTTQYGNMQLVLNPITATNSPYMLVGYEDFALVQTLSMAGSLAAS